MKEVLYNINMKIIQSKKSIFGVNSTHLQHEIILFVCQVLFTIASSISFYKQSYGTKVNDYYTLLLTVLWLGRFLILRIVCVNDYGILSRIASKVCFAGQYFDFTESSSFPVSSTIPSMSSSLSHLDGVIGGNMMLGSLSSWRDILFNLNEDNPNSLWRYIMHSIFGNNNSGRKRDILSGGVMMNGGSSNVGGITSSSSFKRNNNTSSKTNASVRRSGSNSSSNSNYCFLPLQLMVVIGTLMFFTFGLLTSLNQQDEDSSMLSMGYQPQGFHHVGGMLSSSTASRLINSGNMPGGMMENVVGIANAGNLGNHPGGMQGPSSSAAALVISGNSNSILGFRSMVWAEEQEKSISLFTYVFYLTFLGTISSIACFARIVFPFVDLIGSGGNPMSKTSSSAHNASSSSSSSASSSSNAKKMKREVDILWAEQHVPIQTQHRIKLYLIVTLLRLIEAVYLCVILPQSSFTCRVTDHCPSGISFNNIPNGELYYKSIPWDSYTTAIIIISVIFITIHCLFAQMIVLDRHNLSILGYQACESVQKRDIKLQDNDHLLSSSANDSTTYDYSFRRRNSKRTSNTANASLSSHTSNNASLNNSNMGSAAKNKSFFLKFYRLLSLESSHPSTSYILTTLSILQYLTVFTLILMFVLSYTFSYDYHSNNVAFHLVLLSHGIVTWMLCRSPFIGGGKNYKTNHAEIRELSNEMMNWVNDKHTTTK